MPAMARKPKKPKEPKEPKQPKTPKPLPAESLEKLEKLTKLLKRDKVDVKAKAPQRWVNKWRTAEPKFKDPAPKAENTVQAGGMDVDPSLKDEYENWRKDKETDHYSIRFKVHRQGLAAAKARAENQAAQSQVTPPEPTRSAEPPPSPEPNV